MVRWSRWRHITQDTGSVYTLIENRRLGPGPGEVTDSYLLTQARPPDLRAAPAPPPGPRGHQRPLLGGMRPQASIDLGMLHQVLPHSVTQRFQAGHCVQARGKLQPVWAQQPQESLQEEAATRDQDQDVERCGVVMLPALLTTCCRFIAVPISATEQYLISSTGQTYLTEKLPSPVPGAPCPHPALSVTMIMFTASIHDIPSGERLPPLGMASNMTFIM